MREELDNLLALRSDIDEQDALIQQQPATFPLNAVSPAQIEVLTAIFEEIAKAAIGYGCCGAITRDTTPN